MFTLKFIKFTDEGEMISNISVPNYQVFKRNYSDVITVGVYETLFDVDGVERHISSSDRDYDVCFVTNVQGNTIDCIKAVKEG